MQEALLLACRGMGKTSPNPPVGAVVVRNGRCVGKGWHRAAGTAHAEVLALEAAGLRARGATLYVTLEPCSTWGRTPPCTDRILASGIRRVVIATMDPNPRHAGRGCRLLEKQHIDTLVGIGKGPAQSLIAPFEKWITTGMPFVTLKMAMSLDGRVSDCNGRSKWITGEPARQWVRRFRTCVDAIMVGAGTLRKDDPALLASPAANTNPWRVIVGGTVIPFDRKVFQDVWASRTILAVPAVTTRAVRSGKFTCWHFPGHKGRVPLKPLIRRLGDQGHTHVLCEGGPELAASFLKSGLVDAMLLVMAPYCLGGTSSLPVIGGTGWQLGKTIPLRFRGIYPIGDDWMVHLTPHTSVQGQAWNPGVIFGKRGGAPCLRD